jgi:hypothetical protein
MGKQHSPSALAASGFNFYRVTANGKAIVARAGLQLQCRYLEDLLTLVESCGRGIPERELRQFMPPASLEKSIFTLIELGLIERDDSPPPRLGTGRAFSCRT